MKREDFLFEGELAELDPDIDALIGLEEERQARKIILIPSESICPKAVRQALGSVFTSIYAEGYPPLRMTRDDEETLLDLEHQLAYYRRYADRRFYKGADYVHFVETLAQRRAAHCFAHERVRANEIHVNVQPLSGSAANLAVYEAFLEPGDTLMGMDLLHGGHLTHGSEFNVSGRRYRIASYGVRDATARLDYDAIRKLAEEHRPRLIVAGYTSYPWAPDWGAFREVADSVGALLMADIAHPAGLVIAGEYPSPVGIADVITFTTHKTLCGPRGAVILTTDEEKAKRVDSAVFPGEQGGPHVNKFAAMAVAFQLARTERFRTLQRRIVQNARHLATALTEQGLELAYGGTDTHLLMLNLRAIDTDTGFPLRGEVAARILDLCGLVTNKNTVPGDETTPLGMGIRLGTPWVSQRGMGEAEMRRIAELVARVLLNIRPFAYTGLLGELPRGKIDAGILESVKSEVAALVGETPPVMDGAMSGYPHYYVMGEMPSRRNTIAADNLEGTIEDAQTGAVLLDMSAYGILEVVGDRARPFLQGLSTNNVAALAPGSSHRTFLLDRTGHAMDDVTILRFEPDERGRDRYWAIANPENAERVKAWFRDVGDGYVLFDDGDIFAKIEGPVVVRDLAERHTSPGRHLTGMALCGPKAAEVLRGIGIELGEVEPFRCVQVPPPGGPETDSGELLVLPQINAFELFASPEVANEVWRALCQAGAMPAGVEIRDALREQSGLPSYREESRPDAPSLCRSHPDMFCLPKPYFVGQRALTEVRPSSGRAAFCFEEGEDEPRRTPLYEEHRKLTRKLVPFGGWEMPVWYTSASEEHRAVRETAALFDVAHMGVFEVSGEHAASFLDMVTTNYVRWIGDGQSQYGYILDPDGVVLDDVMVYRIRADRYMMVVNAANERKIWAWLGAVNDRRVLIDREDPGKEVEGVAILRDLKALSSEAERRVDLALQGPNALRILQSLAGDARRKGELERLRRTEFVQTILSGLDLVVSRTGYTGEEIGYELFVHPEQAVALWNVLLEHGESFGIRPAGLGARDAARIEAGLPLYGHELAGPYTVSPTEAGFAPYVKFHKPYFVGRRALLEAEPSRSREVVRFRMAAKGVKMIRTGDPVVNRTGACIGYVTSCALDLEGVQLGMACIDCRYTEEGTPLLIFPLPPTKRAAGGKSVEDLAFGDRTVLPNEAAVISRFPERP